MCTGEGSMTCMSKLTYRVDLHNERSQRSTWVMNKNERIFMCDIHINIRDLCFGPWHHQWCRHCPSPFPIFALLWALFVPCISTSTQKRYFLQSLLVNGFVFPIVTTFSTSSYSWIQMLMVALVIWYQEFCSQSQWMYVSNRILC